MKKIIGIAGLVIVAMLVPAACGGSAPHTTVPAASSPTVTLADDGQTRTLRVGDSFLLKLGEEYTWAPTVGDQTIVSRAIGITVVRGAQGVYVALKSGETTLSAAGDPVCRKASPPCEQPSRLFKGQIVVQ